MEKIDKNLLRRYLEHGGDAGVRERLREWFLEHDAEEEFTLREDDPVSGELYAFWGRSLQRSAPQRGARRPTGRGGGGGEEVVSLREIGSIRLTKIA